MTTSLQLKGSEILPLTIWADAASLIISRRMPLHDYTNLLILRKMASTQPKTTTREGEKKSF